MLVDAVLLLPEYGLVRRLDFRCQLLVRLQRAPLAFVLALGRKLLLPVIVVLIVILLVVLTGITDVELFVHSVSLDLGN